jgi:methyltransferase, FkbM family
MSGIGNTLLKKAHKFVKVVSNSAYRRGLQKGVAAAVEHGRLLKTLTCRTVVDIGANRGQFALVAHHCFPEARILSFEPLAQPAEKFRAVFFGEVGIVLHQAAIGPKSGLTLIHVSQRDDSSSLLPITSLQNNLFPGTALKRTETIRVEPLSTFVTAEDIVSPALLKLDVQGYELKALKGCGALLPLFDYVYVECSFQELYAEQAFADEVIGFLQDQGLRLQGVYNMTYDRQGRSVQADFLFGSRRR